MDSSQNQTLNLEATKVVKDSPKESENQAPNDRFKRKTFYYHEDEEGSEKSGQESEEEAVQKNPSKRIEKKTNEANESEAPKASYVSTIFTKLIQGGYIFFSYKKILNNFL